MYKEILYLWLDICVSTLEIFTRSRCLIISSFLLAIRTYSNLPITMLVPRPYPRNQTAGAHGEPTCHRPRPMRGTTGTTNSHTSSAGGAPTAAKQSAPPRQTPAQLASSSSHDCNMAGGMCAAHRHAHRHMPCISPVSTVVCQHVHVA